MREVRVTRTKRNGALEIGFQFKSMDQLLDPGDPSPLPARELTEFAEDYIAGYLNGYNLKTVTGISIGLPRKSLSPDVAALLPETVRRHFSFRIADLSNDIRVSFEEGRVSLAIAILNVAVTSLFITFVAGYLDQAVVILLSALFTILNWVTIWDTYEHFVYDYRRRVRKRQIYRKLAGIEVRAEEW